MDNITQLSDHQKPVRYNVHITQHYDGKLECMVEDVSDDDRSQDAVTHALRRIVEHRLQRKVQLAADGLLAIMLAHIDSAMHCTDEQPTIFKITPGELRSWADAVEAYETERFTDAT